MLHPDGYLEIRDRAKDVIISGGENISSVEVERRWSAIRPWSSRGRRRPDERWGERPVAWVTLRDGRGRRRRAAGTRPQRLAGFKVPDRVEFGELPQDGDRQDQEERAARPGPRLTLPRPTTRTAPTQAATENGPAGWILFRMQIQLRDYRIRHGEMGAWIAGWKSHIVPLREAAGFVLIGAWADVPDDRFVWLLGYAGAEGFHAADDLYYASEDRRQVQPDPSDLVEAATQTMVTAVL